MEQQMKYAHIEYCLKSVNANNIKLLLIIGNIRKNLK